jgi:hypothetical protein
MKILIAFLKFVYLRLGYNLKKAAMTYILRAVQFKYRKYATP